ncbi:MAG: hypothetical protein JSS29_03125 [Proteobacteria bacterium]|nr:hypothetical protein [Pseudomonadota bacterium]
MLATLNGLVGPQLIDSIVLLMVVEALVLRRLARRTSVALGWADVLSLLLPGVFLLAAVRAALIASPLLVALALLAALVAHLLDVRRRIRTSPRAVPTVGVARAGQPSL